MSMTTKDDLFLRLMNSCDGKNPYESARIGTYWGQWWERVGKLRDQYVYLPDMDDPRCWPACAVTIHPNIRLAPDGLVYAATVKDYQGNPLYTTLDKSEEQFAVEAAIEWAEANAYTVADGCRNINRQYVPF